MPALVLWRILDSIYPNGHHSSIQQNNGLLTLQNKDLIYLNSFRMDKNERCFVQTENFGEVLLADSPRFWLLDHLDDSGTHLIVKERRVPLKFS